MKQEKQQRRKYNCALRKAADHFGVSVITITRSLARRELERRLAERKERAELRTAMAVAGEGMEQRA